MITRGSFMSTEHNNESRNRGGLYFVVGALCVAVIVLGFFMFGGEWSTNGDRVDVDVTVPEGTSDEDVATDDDAVSDGGAGEDTGASTEGGQTTEQSE
jgi:hypothetical protein